MGRQYQSQPGIALLQIAFLITIQVGKVPMFVSEELVQPLKTAFLQMETQPAKVERFIFMLNRKWL